MKAKSLLIAGAALAASLMTSKAQVYSQNIVGYINVPLNAGYNLVANQLDLDGTGTNNTIQTVLSTNLPNKTLVYAWNGAGFSSAQYASSSGTWSGVTAAVTNAMQPGEGFFIKVPVSTNLTLVGNVITGTNSYPILAGYNIVAPSAPVAGTIDTTNGFTPSIKDTISVWNGSGFNTYQYSSTGWSPSDPQIPVGAAVFLNSRVNTNWTQVLNVQ